MSTGVQTAIGKFVWHDNMSTDAEKAKKFYTELFGWELEPFPGADYKMIKAGGSLQGVLEGLNRLRQMAVPADHMENGTMLIPGHGRVSDVADLDIYQQMVTIVLPEFLPPGQFDLFAGSGAFLHRIGSITVPLRENVVLAYRTK